MKRYFETVIANAKAAFANAGEQRPVVDAVVGVVIKYTNIVLTALGVSVVYIVKGATFFLKELWRAVLFVAAELDKAAAEAKAKASEAAEGVKHDKVRKKVEVVAEPAAARVKAE